jgi:hypothetical protein
MREVAKLRVEDLDALPRIARSALVAHERVPVLATDPVALLHARRLDVAVKVGYARWRLGLLGGGTFPRALYLDHIRAFNGFVEADGSGKVGGQKFLTAFDELIYELQKSGFRIDRPVPLCDDGTILDGAHRVAACIALGIAVNVVRVPGIVGPNYDYRFFQRRGLSRVSLEAAVERFVAEKPSSRFVFLWPSATAREDEVVARLERDVQVVYCSDVAYTKTGAVRATAEIYRDEPWVGRAEDQFLGAQRKAAQCFGSERPLRVLVVDATTDTLAAVKLAMREELGCGKHSLHTNDTHADSIYLSHVFLNENSRHLLNHSPLSTFPWFGRLCARYARWLGTMPAAEQAAYCLDGSAVLAIYGVRDVRDLDYLYAGQHVAETGFREISEHRDAAVFYQIDVSDIVHDPRHHGYHFGLKVVSAPLLRRFKLSRGEMKDREDVERLDAVLAGAPSAVASPRRSEMRRLLRPRTLVARAKLLALRMRYAFAVVQRRNR